MRKKTDENIELVYKTTIKYQCPKRGWVEEEVEVTRFKAVTPPDGTVLEIDLDDPIEVED